MLWNRLGLKPTIDYLYIPARQVEHVGQSLLGDPVESLPDFKHGDTFTLACTYKLDGVPGDHSAPLYWADDSVANINFTDGLSESYSGALYGASAQSKIKFINHALR